MTPLPRQIHAVAAAFAVTMLGDGLAITALMLDLHDRHAGASAIAALFAAMSLPAVLLAGVSGRIVDRVPPRRLLPPVGAALVAVCTGMAFVESVPLLLALFAVLSALMTVVSPAVFVAVTRSAPGELLSRASARVSAGGSLGILLGTALGGFILDRLTLREVLLIDAASYLAILLAGYAFPKLAPGEEHVRPARSGFLVGVRVMRGHSLVFRLLVLGAVLGFSVQLMNVAEVFLVRDDLHGSATAFGALTMVCAAGQMGGAWLAGNYLGNRPTAGVAYLAAGLSGLLILSIAVTYHLPVLFVIMALEGAVGSAFVVARQTTVGRDVPAEHRGSAAAASAAVSNTSMVFALVAGGILTSVLPSRLVFAIGGGLVLVALAVTATRLVDRRGPRADHELGVVGDVALEHR
ncbi:MFS transporter [Longispora sp. NPDC051575]|uniref:MFS transporter n=1 Tax=Longispora sp. NPDC051575 TaxID=3154943 RepID=UPI00342DC05F